MLKPYFYTFTTKIINYRQTLVIQILLQFNSTRTRNTLRPTVTRQAETKVSTNTRFNERAVDKTPEMGRIKINSNP